MSRAKKILLQLLITGASLCVVLVIFELYLRQSATHIIRRDLQRSGGVLESTPEFLIDNSSGRRRFVPGARVVIKNHYFSGLDVSLDINSIGFRDDEVHSSRTPESLRILVLGDSITVADYLPATRIYVEVLEEALQARFSERTVEVVNTGIGNIGLTEEREILVEKGIALQPDLVLIAFYLNDSRPPWGFSGEIGNRGWLRRRSLLLETVLRSLEEKSWSDEKQELRFGWIEKQHQLDWKTNPDHFLKLAELAQYDWGAAWQNDSWSKITEELKVIQTLSKAHGFRVAVIAFPVKFQVEAEFVEDSPQQKLSSIGSALKFPVLDLLPSLRSHSEENLFYDHCHPTAEGSEFIAHQIEKFLMDSMLLPAPKSVPSE